MEEDIDLREYFKVFIRRWKIIAGLTVLSAVAAAVISMTIPNVYQSGAIIEPAVLWNSVQNQKIPLETAVGIEVLFKSPLNASLQEYAKKKNRGDDFISSFVKNFNIVEDKSGYFLVTCTGRTPAEAKECADAACELIIERENSIMKDAMLISASELNDLSEQLASVKTNLEDINKKINSKDKTDSIAQSNVFRALIEARENTMSRYTELIEKLKKKQMEIGYFTKTASVAVSANLPASKSSPRRPKIVFLSTIAGFFISIFAACVYDYLKEGR